MKLKLIFPLLFCAQFAFAQSKTPLDTEAKAVAFAEKVLFKTYTKDSILQQKPYQIILKDGIWFISGVRKEPSPGGVFYIKIKVADGTVLQMVHGK
jgi:hypothetical protein